MSREATEHSSRFQQYIGISAGPYKSWDPVNQPMIRHWCQALGDSNPVYTDADEAKAQGFSSVVAPPTMMMAWTMRSFDGERPPGSTPVNSLEVIEIMKESGYPATVAVNCEQEYSRYIEEGEDIYHVSTVEDISNEKTTKLGVGFFLTDLVRFYGRNDELVGTMRFRFYIYKPAR